MIIHYTIPKNELKQDATITLSDDPGAEFTGFPWVYTGRCSYIGGDKCKSGVWRPGYKVRPGAGSCRAGR